MYNEVVVPILKDETPPGEGRSPRYNEDTVMAWWNNAQNRLTTMKPMRIHRIYDQVLEVNDLPENHYKPEALYLAGQEVPLRRTTIEKQWSKPCPGYYIHNHKLVVTGLKPKLNFLFAYYAYFKRLEGKKSIVEVPEWAWEACGLYVAMQAVTREAMADARYRKFVTATDAGNPTHNPFLGVAKWLQTRFEDIVRTHADDDYEYTY
jgi:hypothetical protein